MFVQNGIALRIRGVSWNCIQPTELRIIALSGSLRYLLLHQPIADGLPIMRPSALIAECRSFASVVPAALRERVRPAKDSALESAADQPEHARSGDSRSSQLLSVGLLANSRQLGSVRNGRDSVSGVSLSP